MNNEQIIQFIEENHDNTIFGALGIRVESYDPKCVVVAIDVDKRHLQHAGIVHGGVFVTLAESAASMAASLSVEAHKFRVMGMEINANHLRPVSEGCVRARSKLIYQGKSTMVYEIRVCNENEELVCISRCTIAIRPIKN